MKKKQKGGRPANWAEICMARVSDKATKPLKAEKLPEAKKAKKPPVTSKK